MGNVRKVCVFASAIPDGTAQSTFISYDKGKKVLKDGYCMVMLYRRYQTYSVEMTSDKDKFVWHRDPVRMCYVLRVDRNQVFTTKRSD